MEVKIENLGFQCDIINYQKKGWKIETYKVFLPYFRTHFGILGILAWFLFIPILEIRLRKFKPFQLTYLQIDGPRITTIKQLLKLNDKYDFFLVGSDQIWNLSNIKVDDTYFLNFVSNNSKKIAYAPSFGMSYVDKKEVESIKNYLLQFKNLSVREIQGQILIKKMCGLQVPVVLDPTLLIQAEDWKTVLKPCKYNDYILLYVRQLSPSVSAFAQQLSKRTGLKIVQVTGLLKRVETGISVRSPNPLQWLGLVNNAKYVVTNSFHGVAFSINFNKQFFVKPIKNTKKDTNSRIYSLLEQLGLLSQVIDDDFDFSSMPIIDYEAVNRKLNERRNDSISYLKNALTEGYEQ